jgi:hypothetical protein
MEMRFLKRRAEARARTGSRELRQRSLGLPRLVEPLVKGRSGSYSVLDLGPASRSTLDFFLGRGARVTVADFERSSRRELFCSKPESPFDLVLAWEVLNYLGPEDLGPFMDDLSPYVRPGATFHAFVSTGREMAATPSRYRIEDEATLVLDSATHRVPSPRYAEPELLKRMPGLRVEHRFQLRNGMQEYVFSYRPFSVVAGAVTEASTFSMNSGKAVPIHRTTTIRSFSQSM